MNNLQNNARKRKLESIANLLIDTRNDNEFENALKRAREIVQKENLSLKDLMLENLRIQFDHFDDDKLEQLKYENELLREEIKNLNSDEFKKLQLELESSKRMQNFLNELLSKKDDLLFKKEKQIDELESKLFSKKNDKKDAEYWKKNAIGFENQAKFMQEKASTFEFELKKIQEREVLNDYNTEEAIKNFINTYDLKASEHQKNWISTQEIFVIAKRFFEVKNKDISIKKFSLIFGKVLGINSVFGGSRKKNKVFLLESNSILFFAIKSK